MGGVRGSVRRGVSGALWAPGTPRRTLPRTPPIFGDTLGTLRGHSGPEGPERLLCLAGGIPSILASFYFGARLGVSWAAPKGVSKRMGIKLASFLSLEKLTFWCPFVLASVCFGSHLAGDS